jgi:CRP/FNR family cyclic AMP-dependent transcriptional regulator
VDNRSTNERSTTDLHPARATNADPVNADSRPSDRRSTSAVSAPALLPDAPTLHGLSSAQVFPKGIELFSQGRLLQEVLYIEHGWVKISRVDGDGHERILQLACGGTWLGTAAVIARVPSPASAVTCTRTRLARMPADAFLRLLQQDSSVSRQIHEMHARAICWQIGRLVQLSSLTSRERLARIIRHFIAALNLQPTSHGIRLNIPLRQRELAQLILVTPEHLSRLLTEMQRKGVIRREKGWVVVPDVRRLSSDGDVGDGSDAPWFQAQEGPSPE